LPNNFIYFFLKPFSYKFKNLIPKSLEQKFLEKYALVWKMEKEKEIRFFSSIGEQSFIPSNKDQVLKLRNEYDEKKLDELRELGYFRYSLFSNEDLPTLEERMPEFETKWDLSKNGKLQYKNFV
jgi:hypothetical protein